MGGGVSKWLQYYIGVVRKMITVLHKGWSDKWLRYTILGYYMMNIISVDLKKNQIFSVGKNSFLEGMSKWLQLYMIGGDGEMITVLLGGEGGGGRYNITRPRTQKKPTHSYI